LPPGRRRRIEHSAFAARGVRYGPSFSNASYEIYARH
jgi:hypothetical protein